MQIGVQLYTLRTELAQDFYKIMEQVSNLGYEGVEFAGFYSVEAPKMKELLDKLHLKAISSHTSLDDLENHFTDVVNYNSIIGNTNIVIPWTNMNSFSEYEKLSGRIKKVTDKLTEKGFFVHYHNHSHEFFKHNNQYLLDLLYESISSLKAELDLYWITNAGVDALEYYKKYNKRTQLLHFKDMVKVNNQNNFAPVGVGIIDYKAILKEAVKANLEWIIVENDAPKNGGIADISISIRNLKNMMAVK